MPTLTEYLYALKDDPRVEEIWGHYLKGKGLTENHASLPKIYLQDVYDYRDVEKIYKHLNQAINEEDLRPALAFLYQTNAAPETECFELDELEVSAHLYYEYSSFTAVDTYGFRAIFRTDQALQFLRFIEEEPQKLEGYDVEAILNSKAMRLIMQAIGGV